MESYLCRRRCANLRQNSFPQTAAPLYRMCDSLKRTLNWRPSALVERAFRRFFVASVIRGHCAFFVPPPFPNGNDIHMSALQMTLLCQLHLMSQAVKFEPVFLFRGELPQAQFASQWERRTTEQHRTRQHGHLQVSVCHHVCKNRLVETRKGPQANSVAASVLSACKQNTAQQRQQLN